MLVRVQLKRIKGWKMPDNTIKVDRSTRYGNPFRVDPDPTPSQEWALDIGDRQKLFFDSRDEALHKSVVFHRAHLEYYGLPNQNKLALAGKNLACWCKLCDKHKDGLPLGESCPDCAPCHADNLLEFANQSEATDLESVLAALQKNGVFSRIEIDINPNDLTVFIGAKGKAKQIRGFNTPYPLAEWINGLMKGNEDSWRSV